MKKLFLYLSVIEEPPVIERILDQKGFEGR